MKLNLNQNKSIKLSAIAFISAVLMVGIHSNIKAIKKSFPLDADTQISSEMFNESINPTDIPIEHSSISEFPVSSTPPSSNIITSHPTTSDIPSSSFCCDETSSLSTTPLVTEILPPIIKCTPHTPSILSRRLSIGTALDDQVNIILESFEMYESALPQKIQITGLFSPLVFDQSVFVVNATDTATDEEKKAIAEKSDILEAKIKTAIEILNTQPGCLRLNGNTAVVGDIHGDYDAICAIIDKLQIMLDTEQLENVLFLGDFLDRGNSTDTLEKLLDFFNSNPNKVFILRGNHETAAVVIPQMTFVSEVFFQEMNRKYSSEKHPIRIFMNALPHAAIINNDTVAVHGGIPWTDPNTIVKDSYSQKPRIVYGDKCLEEFFTTDPTQKGLKVYHTVICAVWSDFDKITFYMHQNLKRGIPDSSVFGFRDLQLFFANAATHCGIVGLKNLIRGHEHNKGGFTFEQNETTGLSVTTVISSPRLLKQSKVTPIGCVAILKPGCLPERLFGITID